MKDNNLLGLDQTEFVRLAESLGEASFRGKQLYVQLYRRKQLDLDLMTDLSKSFRSQLSKDHSVSLPAVHQVVTSLDGTSKMLFRLRDGAFIETVHIPEESRDTLCISSQVGCDVGCTFCMTAKMGFIRNLRAGEIIGQVFRATEMGLVSKNGFNIVFMGMGEPLYNYKHVMKAFRLLTDPEGMNLSHRRITISTSGVIPVLKQMAAEPKLPNIAISLNATSADVRSRIMPINKRWGLTELLKVCRDFPLEPRRRITIEYVLLKDETDSDDDARRLARLLRGIPSKVNLIPYNPNPGLPHERPEEQRILRFQEILNEMNVSAFVRKTRGLDVAAACGQLAHMEAS